MFIQSKPQRNTAAPDGGGGGAPVEGAAAAVAAQMLAGGGSKEPPQGSGEPTPGGGQQQQITGGQPAGQPQGGGSPAPQFDGNQWIAERTKGRFKTAEEFDAFLSKARTDDDDPEPVKTLREALKSGIKPESFYKVATTDFDAMTPKDKWVYMKMESDAELTREVAEGLFDMEYPDTYGLSDQQKAVQEYRLKQAVKDAEAKWRQTKESMLKNPGYKSAEDITAEIQSKSQQVADIFKAQAQQLKEVAITIDRDEQGNALPEELHQKFVFAPTQQHLDAALAEAINPLQGIADGQTTPEALAGQRFQQILYGKIMPELVRTATQQAYEKGKQEMLARLNNGEFGSVGLAAGRQSTVAPASVQGSLADGVRAQLLQQP